jgi:hypothetical protein
LVAVFVAETEFSWVTGDVIWGRGSNRSRWRYRILDRLLRTTVKASADEFAEMRRDDGVESLAKISERVAILFLVSGKGFGRPGY